MLNHLPEAVVCEYTLDNLSRMSGFTSGIQIPDALITSVVFHGDEVLALKTRQHLGSWTPPESEEALVHDPVHLAAARWVVQHTPQTAIQRADFPEFSDEDWEDSLRMLTKLGILHGCEITAYRSTKVEILSQMGRRFHSKSDFELSRPEEWDQTIAALVSTGAVLRRGNRRGAKYCLPDALEEAMRHEAQVDFSKDIQEAAGEVEGVLRESLSEFAAAFQEELQRSLAEVGRDAEGVNMTAQWLEDHFENLHAKICGYLRKKLPQSWAMDLVEDHCMSFITKMVDKDLLRKTLLKQLSPNLPQMCFWAYQNTVSEMRGWGSDPSLRASRGALTQCQQKERERVEPTVLIEAKTSEPVVFSVSEMVENEQFEKTSAHMRSLLRKERDDDRYEAVFNGLLEGERVKDISARSAIPRSTVSNIKGDIHRVLRRAHSRGEFRAYL